MTYPIGGTNGNGYTYETSQAPWDNEAYWADQPLDPNFFNDPGTTPNIVPPAPPTAPVSSASQATLTPAKLKELRDKGVAYTVLEVWFMPTAAMTRERIMRDFGITDPSKVHEVESKDQQLILVNLPGLLGLPAQPDPVGPASGIAAAQQKLALELSGLDSLDPLGQGYLSVRFTTDKKTREVKDYVVYWISETPQGASVSVLGYRIDGKLYSNNKLADAQKVSTALQELLKLYGYLPEGRSTAGNPDDQVIMNSYSYVLNNPELLQPRRQELEARLNDQQAKIKKLLQQYSAVRNSAEIPAEFKQQVLSELAMKILSGASSLRQLAKNGLDTFTDDNYAQLRANCRQALQYSEKVIGAALEQIIGKSGGPGYLQTVELAAAENKIATYLQTIKEWEKLIKTGAEKEKLREKAIEAGNQARDAINAYKQIFNTLRDYEKNFGWIPGVKERCQQMRQDILGKLSSATGIIARFEQKNRNDDNPDFSASSAVRTKAERLVANIASNLNALGQAYQTEPEYLAEQAQGLYEVAADLSPNAADAEEEKDPDKIRMLYNKASYISEQILANDDLRAVMISFFNMVLRGEDKVSIREVFKKYNELLGKLSPAELEKVGKYLMARQYWAAQGLTDEEIEKKTKSLYNTAKGALDKIENLCKDPKDLLGSSNLNSALQTLIREAYRQMTTYNTWAATQQGKPAITFADFNRLGQKILATLPDNRRDAQRIFTILSEVSEKPAIAREELATKLQDELRKAAISTQQAGVTQGQIQRFEKEAQSINFDQRFFSHLSLKTGGRFQVFHSDDLKYFFPEQFSGPHTEGYYVYGERVNDKGVSELFFEPLPAGAVEAGSVPRQSALGGTVYTRTITEATQKDGAWVINVSLVGKLPTDGSLLQEVPGIGVNALGATSMGSVVTAFSQGDYWIEGGVNFQRGDEKAALDEVLAYQNSGLSQTEIELAKKILRPDAMFTAEEIPQVNALVAKLGTLDVSFLSETKRIIYRQAAADIGSALSLHLKRKGGLNADEVKTLSRLNYFMETYGVMITDGGFIHDEPSQEMINKIPAGAERDEFIQVYRQSIPVLQKVHFQLTQLATQYAPDQRIDDTLFGFYAGFWKTAWKALWETVKPPTVASFQVSGLPPIEILRVKAQLYPDRLSGVTRAIRLSAALEQAATKGKAALEGLQADEIAELKKLLQGSAAEPITDQLLNDIFDSIKQVNELTKQFQGLVRNDQITETVTAGSALMSFVNNSNGKYVYADGKLISRGRMTTEEKAKLLAACTTEADRQAIERLYTSSQQNSSIESFKFQLRQEIIDPLSKEAEELKKQLKAMNDRWENPDALISPDEADGIQAQSKALSRKLNLLQQRLGRLRDLESQLGRTVEFRGHSQDPITFLTIIDQLGDTLTYLQTGEQYGLYNLGDSQSEKYLSGAIKTAVGQVTTAVAGIRGARPNILSWLNAKQTEQIARQEFTDFLTSDKFTRKDWEEFRGRFRSLLEDPNFAYLLTSALSKALVQRDKHIYGPFGRDSGLTPMQALDNFFNSGGEVSLSSTTPEIGEPIEKTFAKIALTKAFGNLPQSGDYSALMPILTMAFGGAGVGVSTYNVVALAEGVSGFDVASYGSESMAERERIVNSALSTLWNNLLTSMALNSNQVSPRMRMASQLHYLMIFSPSGQQYLNAKLEEAQGSGGDLGVTLSEVTTKDIEAFRNYLENKAIPEIQHNPRLARQVKYMIDRHLVISDLLETVVEDAIKAFDSGNPPPTIDNYKGLLDALKLDGNTLNDSMHESGENIPLAQVLEDMLQVSSELNKSRTVEDFKKQALSSLDVPGRVVETRVPHINDPDKMRELREHVQIMDVDPAAEPGEPRTALPGENAYNSFTRWIEVYMPRIYEDFKGAMSNLSPDEIGDFFVAMGEEIIASYTNYITLMPRTIHMHQSNFWKGFGEALKAAARGDGDQFLKACTQMRDAISQMSVSFAIYNGFQFLFFQSVLDKLEQGLYPAAVAEAFVILKMFGGGGGIGGKKLLALGKYAALNAKIAVYDKLWNGYVRGKLGIGFEAALPHAEALDAFAKGSEGKYSYDPATGKLRMQGEMTPGERVRLLDIYKSSPAGQTAVNGLYQATRKGFIPPGANHHVHAFNSDFGVKGLKLAAGITPLQAAVNHRATARAAGNTLQGDIHMSFSSGYEVFAGEATGAKATNWWGSRAYRYASYYTSPRNIPGMPTLAEGWHVTARTAGFVPQELSGIAHAIFGKAPDINTDTVKSRLAAAHADPNGHTTIEIYRVKGEFLREIDVLRSNNVMLENQLKEALPGGDNAKIDKLAKELEASQKKLGQMMTELQARTEKVSIKNSDLLRMVRNPKSALSLLKMRYKFGSGGLAELWKQFKALNEIYTANQTEIEAAAADPNAPEKIELRKMLREIASPADKGYAKQYPIRDPQGRVMSLRGDQIARIAKAVLENKSLAFVEEYGITQEEAARLGNEIRSSFGQSGARRFPRLLNLAAKYTVAAPKTVEVKVADLPAGTVVPEGRETVRLSEQCLDNITAATKAGKILVIDAWGDRHLVNPGATDLPDLGLEERLKARIRVKGNLAAAMEGVPIESQKALYEAIKESKIKGLSVRSGVRFTQEAVAGFIEKLGSLGQRLPKNLIIDTANGGRTITMRGSILRNPIKSLRLGKGTAISAPAVPVEAKLHSLGTNATPTAPAAPAAPAVPAEPAPAEAKVSSATEPTEFTEEVCTEERPTEAKEKVVPEKLVKSGKMTEMEGGVRVGAASPGVIANTAKMGAVGFVVEIPASIIRQALHGEVTIEQTFLDSLNAGKGWAGFGALQGSAMKFLGYSETGGMVFAMAIPTVWAINTNPEKAGQICATSASGLGGFYGGIALANKIGVSKIPNKGAAGLLTTFFGVMGALGATETFSAAYQNNIGAGTLGFGLKDVVDSKAANYTGQALGAIGEPVSYYYGGRIATSAVLRTLAQTGAAEGLGLAGAAGAARIAAWGNMVGLIAVVLTIPGDTPLPPDPYEGKSLADLAQGKIDPITAENSIYKSHLAFELLLCLYKAGIIKRDMIPGQDQEHWDRFMKIFEGIDLNKPETVKEAYDRYQDFRAWRIFLPYPGHTHAMIVDVLAAGIREFKQQAATEGFAVDPEDKSVDANVANLLLTVADKATQIETETAARGKVQAALAKIGISDVELGYGVFSLDDLYPFNRSLNSFIQSQRIYRGDFNGFKIAKVTNDGEFSVSIQGEAMTVRLYDDGGWMLVRS